MTNLLRLKSRKSPARRERLQNFYKSYTIPHTYDNSGISRVSVLLLISRSFMTEIDINAARIIPTRFTFDNYRTIFQKNNYMLYTWNTIKVVGCNMILVPLSASLCAYSFSRLQWKGREFVFSCVLATIMIPGTVLQIPLYVMFYDFQWLGTLKPLIIPAAFGGGAINIFLLRQFMRTIPKEIDEAAIIDGANAFKRYLYFFRSARPYSFI